jgi:p25-alpha
MTDVKNYTGSHKERFDADTGKGKGKEGRSDAAKNTGYVANYKNDGTYGKKTTTTGSGAAVKKK